MTRDGFFSSIYLQGFWRVEKYQQSDEKKTNIVALPLSYKGGGANGPTFKF